MQNNSFFRIYCLMVLLCGFCFSTHAQMTFSFEYLIGKTSAANSLFPELDANQTVSFSIGKKITDSELNWAQYLNRPILGATIEYSNFGNNKVLGSAISLHPSIEVPLFPSKIKQLSWQTGIGIAAFNKKYHVAENWENKAVSTDFTWSFRTFLYYGLLNKSTFSTRLSLGYTHKSNGHTQWPNNGLNSFLAGLNFQFSGTEKDTITHANPIQKTRKTFITFEAGLGQQSLSRIYNTHKPVYGTGISCGRIYNNTLKLGLGFYYRFYQSYYDYIKEEREFINDTYPELKKHPVYNASTYGVNVSAELLMNHVSIITEVGCNIDKPFYKIDYRINNEIYVDGNYYPGEITTKYHIKKIVSGKMGLKYYLWNTKNSPKYNLSVGALICSNLGQADYSELNIGLIHILK